MKNKFVVYTALFGDYDDLIEPKEKFEGCDFICFTDQKNLKSYIWEIRLVNECDLPPNMMNRKYKILPHLFLGEYERSLYVDANIAILGNPLELAEKYLIKYHCAIPKHPDRKCVYDEAPLLIRSGRASFLEVFKQLYFYYKEGYVLQNNFTENNILFRNHNSNICISIMEKWWSQINTYTQRDQLSLGYVLWKEKVNIKYIKENSRTANRYFSINKHKNKQNENIFIKIVKYGFLYLTSILIFKYFLQCKAKNV